VVELQLGGASYPLQRASRQSLSRVTQHPSPRPIVRAGMLLAVAMNAVNANRTLAAKIALAGSLVLISVALAAWATSW
jgi:hypothetical protein